MTDLSRLSRLRLPLLRRRAAGMVEYGALAALIAVAALGAVMLLGQRTGNLTERTNDILVGDAPPPGAPADEPLQGILPGVLVWGPPFLDFALSPVEPTVQATATLANTGGGRSLPFSPPQVSGPDATAFSVVATDCPATLGAGESCTVTVAATAASNGVRTATLGVAGAPGGVSLTAVATGFDPLLVWSAPAAVAIDGTPGLDPLPRTHVQTLTLTNDSFANAPGVAPAVLAASGATATLTHDCPAVLLPSASCTVQVTFAATDNGPISATLTSGGSGPTQPVEVVLAGAATGFAPAFAWSGGGAFTLTAPDSNPATVDQTFTLTNVGTLAGTPAIPTVSGGGPGYNFSFSLASHDCTGILAVGGTCSVTVRATYTDTVADATGTLDGPAALALTGSASGFAPAWAFDAAPDGTFAISSPTTNPASTSKTFTLRNTGTLAGAVPAPSISGSHAGDYAITGGTCAGQTLAPNATCTVEVTFTATGNVSGWTATLAAGTASKSLTGSASGFAPQLAWTSDGASMDVAFPPGPVRTWTLTNVGTLPSDPLTGALALAGDDASAFDLLNVTCGPALPPGGSCTVQTRLAGILAAGTYAATLVASVPGGASAELSATVIADSTPNPFSFASLTNQPGHTVVAAVPVRPTGFNTPIPVSATGGAEITTDGGTTWASSGTLMPGAFLGVRVNTGTPDGGTRAVVVTAGGTSTTWTVGVVDQIPDAFAFIDRMGEDANEMAVSDPVVPTGYNAPTPISVVGDGAPAISVGGGPWTTATTIAPGQAVVVRLTTASSPSTARTATVTIGGVSAAWTVTTSGADTTPDPFTIAALTGQTPNAPAVSSPVLLTGFDAPLTLSVSGDGTPQVSTDNGATWASSRRLRPGQAFLVRLTAGPEGTTRGATVVAGGVSAPWSVQARVRDTTPDAFAIAALTGQPGNTVVESASVTPTGYLDSATISVSGAGNPEISVANGPWTTSATIAPGQSFRVRMTSPAPDGLTRTATVSVGGTSAVWSVTTVDTMPDPLGPFSVTGQTPGSCMTSQGVTFTGMTHPAIFTQASQLSGPTGMSATTFSLLLVRSGTLYYSDSGHAVHPGETYRFYACAPRGTLGQPSPQYTGTVRYTIGGRTYDVSFQTRVEDLFPEAVIPAPVANATPGQMVVSDPFVITGVSGAIPIGFDSAFASSFPPNLALSIDGGNWMTPTLNSTGNGGTANGTAGQGVLLPVGKPVRLRMQAPPAGQQTIVYLRYGVYDNPNYPGSGSISVPWSVSSAPHDAMPDPWRDLSLPQTRVVNGETETLSLVADRIGRLVDVTRIVTDTRFTDDRKNQLVVEGINVPVQASIQRISQNSPGILDPLLHCTSSAFSSNHCPPYSSTLQARPGLRLIVLVGVPVYAFEEATYRLTIGQRSQDFTIRAEADTTPDPFVIPPQSVVEPNTSIVSAPVTITGIEARTRIRVSGDGSPQVSVAGDPWTTDTWINPGQTFRVRLTSAPVADGTARTATVSVGIPGAVGQSVVSADFVVTVADRIPDPIVFAPASDVEPGALVESDAVAITGIIVPAVPFSVSGGAASVNGGPYVTSGTVANGQTVRLRLTAGSYRETRTATLTVGGVSASFAATTRAFDATPDPFSIPALSSQPAGTLVQSAWIRPTGFLDPAPVSVTGGEILVEGDTTWRTSATLEPGQRFRVRLTSGAPGQTVSATVDVGGVQAAFTVTSGS